MQEDQPLSKFRVLCFVGDAYEDLDSGIRNFVLKKRAGMSRSLAAERGMNMLGNMVIHV